MRLPWRTWVDSRRRLSWPRKPGKPLWRGVISSLRIKFDSDWSSIEPPNRTDNQPNDDVIEAEDAVV